MTRALLLLLALIAAPAAAAERTYPVVDFDKIEVRGPYQVTISTGLNSGARAEGTPEALDRVSIDVQGGTLRIRPNASAWGGYAGDKTGPITVRVTARDLRAVTVIGSGGAAVDRLKGLRVDLSLSGSGQIAAGRVDADNLVLGLLGGGRLTLGGHARQLRATIQGSGDLAAEALTADDAVVFADTAGTVRLAATRSAKVTATGSGDVVVEGRAACTVSAKGAGVVRCGGR